MGESQETNNSLDNPPLNINLDLEELEGIENNQNIILGEIKENQKLIIENQKKLIDYFVPTEEELKQQKLQEQKIQEEEQKIQEQMELEQQELEEEEQQKEEEQQLYNQQVLKELTTLNENISKVEFVNQNTNAYLYVLCFGFLFAFVITFIYKLIKKFL